MHGDRSFALLLLCFFLSGLAALVYETAWTREFALVFGTSHLAVATVLAAYMAGLAAGAAAAARLAHRVTRPVRVYGLLELGIAVTALGVPLAIGASRALYVLLFGGRGALPEAGGGLSVAFYAACSFAILMVPTAMMGATLPLLVRHAVRSDAEIGRRSGLLYATNTAGAVAGTLLAAFVLLPTLGLRGTVVAAAGVNAAVFFAAWGVARSVGPVPLPSAGRAVASAGGREAWILPLILVSGAVSFTYEVFWVRLLGHVVGGSVQAFATMLASFLGGIALGSAAASRWADTPRRAALGFALAQLGVAGLSLAAFLAIERLPRFAGEGTALQAGDVLACMATLFPAALCIGATFPFAVRVLARAAADAGAASARVYAANTLGSIAGAVGAGFLVIPALGFAGTLAAGVATNLALAAAAALLFAPRRRALAGVAALGVLGVVVLPPSPPWGLLRSSPMNERPGQGRIAYLGIGRAASVLLLERAPYWHLRTDGLPESSIDPPGVWHNRLALARWLTALPVLARPDTRSLLVVGLGGGVALETVPPGVERVDVVELEPEVVAANRAVAGRRWRDPLADPRVRVHLNDARNALLLGDARFDAIVSQPSHPWAGGAAHLYTKEFFELARRRLAPEGVFVQWIGLRFVDEALFRSLLATLAEVFSHVRVYNPPPGTGVLFIASDAPLAVERTAPRSLDAWPEAFATLGLHVAEDVNAHLLLEDGAVRALARGAPQNRDGHNRLQSRSSGLGEAALDEGIHALTASHDPLAPPEEALGDRFYLLRQLPRERAERVAESFPDATDREVGRALVEIAAHEREAPRRRLEEALREGPRHREARAALLRLSAGRVVRGVEPDRILPPPLEGAERLVARGWRARDRGHADVLRALDAELAAVPPRHPLAPDAIRLRIAWRLRSGEPADAREAIALADRNLDARPEPADLLLRARACVRVGDPRATLASLLLLVQRLEPGAAWGLPFLREARDVLGEVPADPSLAPARVRVQRALQRRS